MYGLEDEIAGQREDIEKLKRKNAKLHKQLKDKDTLIKTLQETIDRLQKKPST
jgi:predicted RNase H-like nuclease (RuvC/YqgF family)